MLCVWGRRGSRQGGNISPSTMPRGFMAAATKCHHPHGQAWVVPMGVWSKAHEKSWWQNSAFSSQGSYEHTFILREKGRYRPCPHTPFYIKYNAELTGSLTNVQAPCGWHLRTVSRNIYQEWLPSANPVLRQGTAEVALMKSSWPNILVSSGSEYFAPSTISSWRSYKEEPVITVVKTFGIAAMVELQLSLFLPMYFWELWMTKYFYSRDALWWQMFKNWLGLTIPKAQRFSQEGEFSVLQVISWWLTKTHLWPQF